MVHLFFQSAFFFLCALLYTSDTVSPPSVSRCMKVPASSWCCAPAPRGRRNGRRLRQLAARIFLLLPRRARGLRLWLKVGKAIIFIVNGLFLCILLPLRARGRRRVHASPTPFDLFLSLPLAHHPAAAHAPYNRARRGFCSSCDP